LGFVAVVSIPFLVFAAIAGTRLSSRADAAAARSLAAEAQTVADRVDDYLESHQRAIVLAAADAVGTMHRGTDFGSTLRDLSETYGDFLSLLVADSTGQIIAAHVPRDPQATIAATSRTVADREYFRAAMSSNGPFLSDVFRGRGVGTDAIVAISAPIRDNRGRPTGVIEGSLDLHRFEAFARGAQDRASGHLVIVDRASRVVYATPSAGFALLQDVANTAFGTSLTRAQTREPISFPDYTSGEMMLGGVAQTSRNGWRVVVAQPTALAHEEGRTYLATILVGFIVAAAVAAFLAMRLGSTVTRPINQLIDALRSFDVSEPRAAEDLTQKDAPREVAALVGEFSMMTARVRAAAEAQRASESRFRAIFDHAAIGIAVHDNEGRFVDANPAFGKILGYSTEELRHRRASELSPAEEAEVTREPVRALKAGTVDTVRVEKKFLHRDGHALTCELTVSRLESATDGAPNGGMVGMLQDITERRQLERDIVWRANHDTLTGLANRACLRERLQEALGRMRLPGAVAVLLLDLDEFKRVNDVHGHSAGDQLLCEVARRLLSATRGCDVVARLGGDEFALVLDGVDSVVFADIAANRILAALRRPIAVDGAELVLSTSIGIAYATSDDTVDSLMRNADTAMYSAKNSGKGKFDVFTSAMHEDVMNMLSLEVDLRQAVDTNALRAVYQMVVDLRTGRPVGAECLLRWEREGHGTVSPTQFIPLAEQTGLIVPIGRWILQEACRQGALWQSRAPRLEGAPPPFSISVNVSGRQLQHPALIDDVRHALASSGLDPRALVLELTESVVLNDANKAIERLHALRALGVRVAIDDFGTGYSSLSYLQVLPVDILKLDKSFVDRMTKSSRDAAFVRVIVGLAESLSLRCVAEGIEQPEQQRLLAEMGCGFGQGYLFARPLDADAAGRALIESSRCEQAA